MGLLLDEAGGVGRFGGNVELVRLGPGLGIEISVGADRWILLISCGGAVAVDVGVGVGVLGGIIVVGCGG